MQGFFSNFGGALDKVSLNAFRKQFSEVESIKVQAIIYCLISE